MRSKFDLEGQGNQVKNVISGLIYLPYGECLRSRVMGQGQRSLGSRSKVKWVKPNQKGHDIGRWAHVNVKLLHLEFNFFQFSMPQ